MRRRNVDAVAPRSPLRSATCLLYPSWLVSGAAGVYQVYEMLQLANYL